MFVLGVDPGLAATGYAVVREGARHPEAAAVGVIRTSPAHSLPRRLAELYDDLALLIEEHRPDEMAIEQVFVNRNLRTATAVGRASGVALLAAGKQGVPVHEYSPSGVKNAVAGFGSAGKDQLQSVLARRFGVERLDLPADAADALAVALCHLQTSGLRSALADR